MHHLRAVIVCGMVIEGRNYLFIFDLGSVVTNRVHKLQKVGRDMFLKGYLSMFMWRQLTHTHTEVLAAQCLCGWHLAQRKALLLSWLLLLLCLCSACSGTETTDHTHTLREEAREMQTERGNGLLNKQRGQQHDTVNWMCENNTLQTFHLFPDVFHCESIGI